MASFLPITNSSRAESQPLWRRGPLVGNAPQISSLFKVKAQGRRARSLPAMTVIQANVLSLANEGYTLAVSQPWYHLTDVSEPEGAKTYFLPESKLRPRV